MTLPSEINPALLTSPNVTGDAYNITKSLRFRASASAYLNRTPASAGNQQKWTWSGWVKRGILGAQNPLFYSGTAGTNYTLVTFTGGDFFQVTQNDSAATTFYYQTSAVFRDPSAWYHLVAAVDTTNATDADRVKLYVNGVRQTIGAGTNAPLNQNTYINAAAAHYLGYYGAPTYLDGYMAEVNFIDGQALTPSSFGRYNQFTGVWQPKACTVSDYGKNGFYLPFNDTTSTTALGYDEAAIATNHSAANNWTPNNISLTAGSTYDSMLDSPTPTTSATQTFGNYCTINPIASLPAGAGNLPSFSNANLTISGLGAAVWYEGAQSTFGLFSGKTYYEITVNSNTSGVDLGIIAQNNYNINRMYRSTGNKVINSVSSAYGASFTNGDIIGFAIDLNNGTLTCYKNGVSQGVLCSDLVSAFPAGGWFVNPQVYNSGVVSMNFGQQPFAHTPPTGFNSLCTSNLPANTTAQIANGASHMAATLYTGTGATQTINDGANNNTGVQFQPDLVWIKSRSAATNNNLFDSVNGATKYLISNATNAQATDANTLTAFGGTGFTLGSDAGSVGVNINTNTYVAWQWKAGQGVSSSNTDGSITSAVSVNRPGGFSVVTYTGTGANATVGHGLGVAPSMIITKNSGATSDWGVYHTSLGNTNYMLLDTTAASAASSTYWNNTSPTSSVFSIGTATPVNVNTNTYVAYCWAAIPGFSAFGSYTGNGSTDGPFIYTGFRPRWIMTKVTSSAGNYWIIHDTSRNPYNAANLRLYANTADAEATLADYDVLSNGFKLRTSIEPNISGGTYIYAAFAENPFRYSLAR